MWNSEEKANILYEIEYRGRLSEITLIKKIQAKVAAVNFQKEITRPFDKLADNVMNNGNRYHDGTYEGDVEEGHAFFDDRNTCVIKLPYRELRWDSVFQQYKRLTYTSKRFREPQVIIYVDKESFTKFGNFPYNPVKKINVDQWVYESKGMLRKMSPRDYIMNELAYIYVLLDYMYQNTKHHKDDLNIAKRHLDMSNTAYNGKSLEYLYEHENIFLKE